MYLWLDAGSASAAGVGVQTGPLATTAYSGLVSAPTGGFTLGPTPGTGSFATFWGHLLQDSVTSFVNFKGTTACFGFRFYGAAGTAGTQHGWAKVGVDLFGTNGEGARLIALGAARRRAGMWRQ